MSSSWVSRVVWWNKAGLWPLPASPTGCAVQRLWSNSAGCSASSEVPILALLSEGQKAISEV